MSAIDQLQSIEEWEAYFDGFKANLAPLVHDTGENLAFTDADPKVHPEQTVWARQMQKGIYMPVDGKVYVAVGYHLCSTTMVVGTDGVVIIDPGENDRSCGEAMKDLRRFSDLPVRAVVYTHRHPDHAFALLGCGITRDDITSGKVDVVAHQDFEKWMINDASVIGPILSARTALGSYAGESLATGAVHGALGPVFGPGPTSTSMPTVKISEPTDLDLGGVKMTVFPAYGDAQDEVDLWFPEFAHVHGSETVQGETFPNLYTLRGTSYRDLESWFRGVDALLDYAKQANSYSGSHMRPWVGNDFLVERITNYRDAIQFLFDQCVRYMNKGYTGPELIDAVAKRLPDHLRDDPWLQPYYGAPEHVVREVYVGLLGWYSADPTELAAPVFAERAARYVEALGGRDAVVARAQAAFDTGDHGWCAELLTHVIRIDTTDQEARHLKAEALRQWGYQQKNMYWRTHALGAAQELDDQVDLSKMVAFAAPDVVRALPVAKVVESLRVRLDADRAKDEHRTLAFSFTDTDEDCALEIRRGVAVFHEPAPDGVADTIVTTSDAIHQILLGEVTPADALAQGSITLRGDQQRVHEFLGFFEPPASDPPKLSVR
jgi:alkyl sulfatase BDS1-like metallo-beta-lactamase superfamily hydrolase